MPWAGSEWSEAQPRKYNGKEWVEAFGYDNYLYGARDYYSAIGRFTVVDPFAEKYAHISPYAYCANNPIKYVDPDGRWIESLWDAVNVAMGVESFVSNIHEGNVSDALVDGVGIALDAIATILPVVPGGVSTTIKAVRTADKVEGVLDVDKIIHKSNKVGPIPNGGIAKQHGGLLHNKAIDEYISDINKCGGSNIRKNQVQVDINGMKVGNNRPDIQYDFNDIHYNVEYDYKIKNSQKHYQTIVDNDPNSVVDLHILTK